MIDPARVKLVREMWESLIRYYPGRAFRPPFQGRVLRVPELPELVVQRMHIPPHTSEVKVIEYRREPLFVRSGHVGWIITADGGIFVAIAGLWAEDDGNL